MVWAILGIVASFIENMSVVFEKKTLIKEHAMEFTCCVLVFAMLFTTPLWLFTRTDIIGLQAVWLIFLSGVFLALSLFFFAKAFRHMATPYTNPFLAFIPVVVAVFAWSALGESLTLVQWLGILAILKGSYILYAHSHKDLIDPLKKSIHIPHLKFVILAILSYAATSVLDRKIVGDGFLKVAPFAYLVLLFFFAAIVLIIMMLLFHDGFKGIENGMINNTLSLSALAAMLILSKGLLVFALTIPGILVSSLYAVKQLSQILSMAVSGELFHKTHLLRNTIACLVLIVGVVLVVM